jgi:TPR repeat protein
MKRRTTALPVGGLIALALIGLASAGPLEDGVAAYRQGDFTTAMRLLRPLADEGDAKAEFHLGRMYALGQGVGQDPGQDPGQAIAWYRKAAQHGDAEAEFVLGVMFLDRSGAPQEEALLWLRKLQTKVCSTRSSGSG